MEILEFYTLQLIYSNYNLRFEKKKYRYVEMYVDILTREFIHLLSILF